MSLKIDQYNMLNFDGTSRSNFREYKTKLLAIGALKSGFDEALLNDLPTIAGDTKEKENREKNVTAWSYLTLTLDGVPGQMLSTISDKKPYKTWKMLCNMYDPTDVSAFTRLNQELQMAELEDPYGDPEPWIVNLVSLKARLGVISQNYLRDDMQLISYVLMKLPKELYGLFITTYQVQGFTSITLLSSDPSLESIGEAM